jgi:hypothetical protein
MKKVIFTLLLLMTILSFNISAQETTSGERFGGTLNLGLGIGGYYGYYGYLDGALPVFNINYELGVANNFTLAPFVTFYSYSRKDYRETVIPIGVKGTYYFDGLLRANSNWDFYLAGSLGFAFIKLNYYDSYSNNDYKYANPLFLDIHVGTEYHITSKLGVYLDLSSGVSTLGLAIH